MSRDTYKTFSCEYPFEGGTWCFEIMARDEAEAEARRKAIAWGKVEGEVMFTVRAPFMTRPAANLIIAIRNWWRG